MTLKNFSPYNVVKESISELKPNETKVVSGRFGINSERKTLSLIGRELKLSRERIRQIEKEALRKLSKEIVDENNHFINEIIESFEQNGGITGHNNIADKFLSSAYQKDKNEFNSLHLIFVIMPQLMKIEKTKELEAGWMLASLSKSDAVSVIDDWVNHLKRAKKPLTLEVLVEANPKHKKHKVAFLSELPQISKKLIKTSDGMIGLATWPEVNPRNVRDKIFFILKKANKPMHFDEIAKSISGENFDRKKVVKATVHNELIADDRFVLVGRGIYALSEWGYEQGTVAEIIKNILADKKAGMTVAEIVEAVLKQRLVKKNTIIINLQTKPAFKKVGQDKYSLT